MRRWNLIDLAAACLFPLVPALLLYGLFSSQNSATYDNAGLKLGGPVALYFVLVLLAFRYVGRWRIASDPFEKLKKDLVGAWDVEAVSATAMAGSRRGAGPEGSAIAIMAPVYSGGSPSLRRCAALASCSARSRVLGS